MVSTKPRHEQFHHVHSHFRHLRCHVDPLLDLTRIQIEKSRMPHLPFDARAEPLPELQDLLLLPLGFGLGLFLCGFLSHGILIMLNRKHAANTLHLIRGKGPRGESGFIP